MSKFEQKRDRLLKELLECSEMVKGSISAVCSTCTRANCICERLTKSKTYRLTFKDKSQRTKTVYVPRSKLREMKKMISNYKRCRGIVDELTDINIMIFKNRFRDGS